MLHVAPAEFGWSVAMVDGLVRTVCARQRPWSRLNAEPGRAAIFAERSAERKPRAVRGAARSERSSPAGGLKAHAPLDDCAVLLELVHRPIQTAGVDYAHAARLGDEQWRSGLREKRTPLHDGAPPCWSCRRALHPDDRGWHAQHHAGTRSRHSMRPGEQPRG